MMNQVRKNVRLVTALFGAVAALLGLVVMLSFAANEPIDQFFRDPAGISGLHPLVGMVSFIGILLWGAAATVCAFTWFTLRIDRQSRPFSAFLLTFAGITTVLLVDDLFLVHERLAPNYLGVDERVVFVVYAAMLALGLLVFRKTILKTDYLLLVFAFGFFGMALSVDVLPTRSVLAVEWSVFVEDSLKLFGITSWAAYFTRCCSLAIRTRILANAREVMASQSGLGGANGVPATERKAAPATLPR